MIEPKDRDIGRIVCFSVKGEPEIREGRINRIDPDFIYVWIDGETKPRRTTRDVLTFKYNDKGSHGKAIGDANRERIREFMATHIGATNRECGEALGLGESKVGRHIKAIRAEWLGKEEPK